MQRPCGVRAMNGARRSAPAHRRAVSGAARGTIAAAVILLLFSNSPRKYRIKKLLRLQFLGIFGTHYSMQVVWLRALALSAKGNSHEDG